MARRSSSLTEVAELRGGGASELSCNWALLHGGSRRKPVTNGRPERNSITDYPRKFDQIASFDDRCRKFQNEAGLASIPADVVAKSVEDMLIKKYTDGHTVGIAKEQQYMETEFGSVVKLEKRRRKKVQNVYQSSSCYCTNAACLIPHLTSTSAEVPGDKLTIAAILGEVHDHNNWEEQLGRVSLVNEIKTRQVQMCAKALADKMSIDRQVFHKEGFSSEGKPFSSALEVLNSSKRFFVNLQEPFVNVDYEPADEIVIMKPVVARSAECSENIKCSCSSNQPHCKFCEEVSSEKAKTASFSFREIKRKLKHRFRGKRKEANEFLADCTAEKVSCIAKKSSVSSTSEKIEGKVREKLDFPSMRVSEKQGFDVVLEAKRHLSERLKNLTEIPTPRRKRSPENLGKILSLSEYEFRHLSPRSVSQSCSGSPQMRYSPCSATSAPACYRALYGIETTSAVSSLSGSIDEADDIIISSTGETNTPTGEPDISELTYIKQDESYITDLAFEINYLDDTSTMLRTNTVHGSALHAALDSVSSSEIVTSASDDCTSPHPSIFQLERTKDQEEHQSPVSVLEAFYTEDDSPPSITLQTERKLQPRRLDFDGCSFKPSPQDQSVDEYECIDEEDYITLYVHLVLKASRLTWNELFQIESQPDVELLHESILDELDFLPADKLLFNHMNEVLLQIYESHCCCPWPGSAKQDIIRSVPLENLVLDEIMKEADFYLLPRTERKTLEQLVSQDIACSKFWLNAAGKEKEEIVIDISEEIVEDLVLDMILDFQFPGMNPFSVL